MSDQLRQIIHLANKDFSLEIPHAEVQSRDEFKLLLTDVISHLMDNDFQRLLNGLYRIDVSEEKVKLALASDSNIAEQIAQLIIDRELQKVETRAKYRGIN